MVLFKMIEVFAYVRIGTIVNDKNNLMKGRYDGIDKYINNKHKNTTDQYSEDDNEPRYAVKKYGATAEVGQKCYRNKPYHYAIKK